MGQILIIVLGVLSEYEDKLIKYLIKQGHNLHFDIGLFNYDTVLEAKEDLTTIEKYNYKYYLVLGEEFKRHKIERLLPPDRILGFSWAHYLDLQDKKIFVVNSDLEKRIHGLRLADEGMCASITFVPSGNYIAENYDAFWEADVLIDENRVLKAESQAAFLIEKLVKEKNNEN